jgi:hypothetical protein
LCDPVTRIRPSCGFLIDTERLGQFLRNLVG